MTFAEKLLGWLPKFKGCALIKQALINLAVTGKEMFAGVPVTVHELCPTADTNAIFTVTGRLELYCPTLRCINRFAAASRP
jgi:hypothetical protein